MDNVSKEIKEYGTVKTLLPEAGALERATTYRDKKIKPLFTQVKNKIAAMAAQVKELAEEVEKWKHKYQKTKQAYNQIQRELDAVREEKEQLFDEKQQLQDVSDRYDRVVRVLGENAVDDAVQQDIQEQKALEEKRQMEQMPTGSIHERLAWGARKSSRKAALWQSKNPVTFELIGEARKMAVKVGYQVNCVIVGGKGTKENAEKLLPYGVDNVYVYEHEGFEGFRADCYTDAVADCIAANKPSSVLIGATALGRSLAPRLSTRFHTGLTADCTTLDIRSNTDMIQIRPAFGGNIMAQIGITKSRPQFATVRYKVMDKAEKVKDPHGQVIVCPVNEKMADSRIKILSSKVIDKVKSLEEEDVLVVAGRGVRNEKDVEMCRELAEALGGQLAFTRPMVENGFGDVAHQIGLSGRTVRPKLIITCGVSGAIQFTSCMTGSDCIVAINNDPEAQIFNVADYCIVDDLYQVVPELTELIKNRKED